MTVDSNWFLQQRNPSVIRSLFPYWDWIYRYYFRVKTDGWHHIPSTGQVLLVGSHNGGLAIPDMSMMMYDWFRRFGTERLIYGLSHPSVWKNHPYPFFTKLAMQVGAIPATPRMAFAALRKGSSLLVYPGGARDLFRPYTQRNQIYFAGQKGFIKLALQQELPIIPLISKGAHETLIILGDLSEWIEPFRTWGFSGLFPEGLEVFPFYLGLPWGLAIGPLPNIPFPVQIHTRVCPPITFSQYGKEAAQDRAYVESCYWQVVNTMQGELDQLIGEN
ncbi:glycerol acyltransferase [Aphanothece hegewaldii CCALA 016]|uniref:Glycerol acyltransferase n=1 Tax=Aphanothece hegewaldii CCALA 016 TaxID=2107694 RepID=A0A2T1LXN7_9CHRO|nr:lysophospholipid acyltransferase family protein [Aphanothece hegewaldii]PSF37152.1 glycerol acyltransferase [Aphanothece hegewaldii CCALA 016]